MTNKQILIIFLKKHRKYSSFKRQVVKDDISKNASTRAILLKGFYIEDSEEGPEKWQDLNTKWNKLVNDFNLNPQEVIDLTTI